MTEFFAVILVLFFAGDPAFAVSRCPQFLARVAEVTIGPPRPDLKDMTTSFIAYLAVLVDHRIIGDKELTRLISNLEGGTLTNPIFEEETQINSGLYIHWEGLEQYIKGKHIRDDQVLAWARENLKDKERVRTRREENNIETRLLHGLMQFNKIAPGHYASGTIDAFEMMSTLVTQKHWSVIMGSNPSNFVDGEDTMVMSIGGKAIKMQPDNPVENIRWNDAQNFVAKMNELSQGDDPRLYGLIPDHKAGDRFRLPTDAEWDFVVRNRGNASGIYYFGNSVDDLKNHAWYAPNSNSQTHPVAQRDPLIVDGNKFYDILGNVWEWTQDSVSGLAYIRGGAWNSDVALLHSGSRIDVFQGHHSHDLGFRLVRVRP